VIAEIVGGLGLFLLGMWLMTDGLRLAAGDTLKGILARWTSSPLRGLATGVALTGLVQSSSVVSMTTIGFANAGLLSLSQAIWVIYGANVGTTLTGWIVEFVGFRLDIGLYAMPVVGIGMALKLSGRGRQAAFGQALAGFGVLFLGIAALKGGFETTATGFTLPQFEGAGLAERLAYFGVGLVLTTLMQSSSAFLVVALSALSSGLVSLPQAAALVLGSVIGTTTTAIVAAFGGTPAAKRVASSHVIFACLAAALGFVLMTPLLAVIARVIVAAGFAADDTLVLVLFFTAVKLAGVAAIAPLTPALTRLLERRFVPPEADAARLRHLDRNVLQVPSLALQAGLSEVGRLRTMSVEAIDGWLAAPQAGDTLEATAATARQLADAIAEVLTELTRGTLGQRDVQQVQLLLRILQHYLAALHDARRAAATFAEVPETPPERRELQAAIRDAIRHPEQMAKPLEKRLKAERDMLKEGLLARVASGRLSLEALDAHLRGMNSELRMLRHLRKGHRYIEDFETAEADTDPEVANVRRADAA
jgi:phosphate:Na+ symporter